jgi:hypothetical protein
LLYDLLTQGAKLSPQEILERQKMFTLLAKDDKYEDLKKLGEKISWIVKFLPMYHQVIGNGGFLEFNTAFCPGIRNSGVEMRGSEKDIDYCIMYLRLNQKVLGKDFPKPVSELLEKLKKRKSFSPPIRNICGIRTYLISKKPHRAILGMGKNLTPIK